MLTVNTQTAFPPTGFGPYLIDRRWCLGDSLPYINGNTNIFANSINTLNTAIATTSATLSATLDAQKLDKNGDTASSLTVTSGLTATGNIFGRYPAPGYIVYIDTASGTRSLPSQFNKAGTPPGVLVYGQPSFGDIFYAAYPGTVSFLFEMKVYASTATSVTQFCNYVDDNIYFYLNSNTAFKQILGAGAKNELVTWNFAQGLNTVQIVFNNIGGGPCQVNLYGDFFLRNSNLSFVPPV